MNVLENIYRKASALAVLFSLVALGAAAGLAQSPPDILWEVDGHDDEVYSVTFNARGTSVLSGGGADARIWDTEIGTLQHTFGPHPADLLSVALSPDGTTVAAGWVTTSYPQGGLMRLWDVVSENTIRDHGGARVAFSPDGTLVAAGGGGFNRYVRLYRVDSGLEYGDVYCGPGYITSLAFAPDRGHLAVGTTNNLIKVWDLDDLTLVHQLDGFIDDVSAIAYSPDGSLLAGAEGGYDIDDDVWIRLFHTDDGASAGSWEAHGQTTFALTFAPGGDVVASSGRDGSSPQRYSIRYWNVADGQLLHEYDELALSLDISPDGSRICYGGLYGRVVVAEENLFVTTSAPTPIPLGVKLHAALPNPFNPITTIAFELPEPATVELKVYDMSGRLTKILIDRGQYGAGSHSVTWTGQDTYGTAMPSGTYCYRLQVGGFSVTKRMALIR